jgi:prophage antirepressor-like protein
MNNELQLFGFDGQDIRVSMQNGEPWFVLKDVCGVLGVGNSRDVSARLADDEKGVDLIDTLGGKQEVTIINEFGLYSVLSRSDKPEAKRFQRWVNHEVLPSIRKHGGYIVGQSEMSREEFLAKALRISDDILKEKDVLIAKQGQELIVAQPKIESFDALMRSTDHMSITECAKHFNLHPKVYVFPYLREHGYLTSKELPSQKALDGGYMVLRQNPIPGTDRFNSQAIVLKKHLEVWRTKLVPKIMKEFDL